MTGKPGPLYARLAADLRTLIVDGGLRPGDALPSLREQSALRGVSLGTVKEAYALLEREGLVQALPQSGFRVVGAPRPQGSFTPGIIGLDPSVYGLFRIDRVFQQQHQNRPGTGANFSVAQGDLQKPLLAKLRGYTADILGARPEAALGYAISPGSEELRTEVSRYLGLVGVAVPPGEVAVTSGCTESLTLGLLASCREGDAVAVESPCSFNILSQLAMLRFRPVEISVDAGGLDLDAFEARLRSQRIAALITSPNFNNPTGALMPDQRRRDLVALCGRHGVRILEDDVYGDLHLGPVRPRPLKALEGALPILYCSSFSKTLAPGLRVGLIAAGDLQSRVETIGAFTSLAGNTLAQLLVARLLRDGDYARHLRQVRRALGQNFLAMGTLVAETFPPGTTLSRPDGGLVLWIGLPGNLDGQRVYEKALDHDILVAPGTIFSTTGSFRNHIRVNAGVWNPKLEAGLRTLGALVTELYRAP